PSGRGQALRVTGARSRAAASGYGRPCLQRMAVAAVLIATDRMAAGAHYLTEKSTPLAGLVWPPEVATRGWSPLAAAPGTVTAIWYSPRALGFNAAPTTVDGTPPIVIAGGRET